MMSSQAKKTVIISVITAVVVAVACVTTVLLVSGDGQIWHIQTNGLKLSLIRNKLVYNDLKENGTFLPETDKTEKDFSKPTQENIFGITGNAKVIPGCMYSAEMTVAAEDNDQAFVYWLEVKLNQGGEAIKDVFLISISVDGGKPTKFKLSNGHFLGSETNPIASVAKGEASTFTVKLELSDNFSDNKAQGAQVSIDLVVHAVPVE